MMRSSFSCKLCNLIIAEKIIIWLIIFINLMINVIIDVYIANQHHHCNHHSTNENFHRYSGTRWQQGRFCSRHKSREVRTFPFSFPSTSPTPSSLYHHHRHHHYRIVAITMRTKVFALYEGFFLGRSILCPSPAYGAYGAAKPNEIVPLTHSTWKGRGLERRPPLYIIAIFIIIWHLAIPASNVRFLVLAT